MSNPFKYQKPVATPMHVPQPSELRKLVFKQGKAMRATLKKLKQRPPKDLDDQFEKLHNQAFKKIDCLNCVNCCKTTSPMLFEKDIERLSQRLKMKPGDFTEQYLILDTDQLFCFKSAPCPFLNSDNSCDVYDDRPKACREFPHTNQRKMHTQLALAHHNIEICPAVYAIVEQLNTLA
jgi:Fe-S-cluster containining protein